MCSTWSTVSSRNARSWLIISTVPSYELEELLEPLRRLEIEMVRRLVEQQDVRGRRELRGEADASALAAAQLDEQPRLRVAGSKPRPWSTASTGVVVVAAGVGEAFLIVAVLRRARPP